MTGSGLSQLQTSDQTKLTRGLKSRHVELIAIGGAIGVGLFLGSAKAIQNAGPGLILGYAFGGVAIFFIMRALGELLLYRPIAGSFVMYADEFICPFAGFATGWSYWFMWVVTGMAELTAIGVYVGYWLPDLPQWIWVLAALVVLYGANMLAVRVFGEMEFWFALIKVAMIVMLIVGGLAVIFFRVGDLRATAGFSNLWSHGGFFALRHSRCVAHIPDGDVRVSGSGADRCDRRRGRKSRGRPAPGHHQHHLPYPDLLYWRIGCDHVAHPLE